MSQVSSSEAQTPVTVYEDDEIKVLWYEGNSEFLLVTFGDLVTLVKDDKFFADKPIKKLGINCLGFMAKSPNWFPSCSVLKAIGSIQDKLDEFEEIVTYGGSMGGYAAIKYSRKLKANAVVAFCPQWSIDKDECSGRNPGYQKHYKAHMKGMGITECDVNGDIYVFYDPGHSNDAFHANRILGLSKSSIAFRMYSTDHHVTGVLAGTDYLKEILSAALDRDNHRMSLIVNTIRRQHHLRSKTLASRLADRHPLLLDNILENEKIKNAGLDMDDVNGKILRYFIASRKADRAKAVVDRISSGGICKVRRSLLIKAVNNLIYDDGDKVTTVHGTEVIYSIGLGRLIHSTDGVGKASSGDHFRVLIDKIADEEMLAVNVDGELSYIAITATGSALLLDGWTALNLIKSIIRVERRGDRMHLRCGSTYMSAEPSGRMVHNRPIPRAWEEFKCSQAK